jgi:DNA-binding NarL/FixJ family response regulator
MQQNLTIYIADDHQIVIDGISLLLKSEERLLIIGTANNGQNAYNDIIEKKPDIALLDLRMPEKSGMDIIKSLINKTNTKFIILSMQQERRLIMDAINYNAYAYLLKNVGKKELIDTIYRVGNNEKLIDLNSKLLNEEKTFLSPREIDVLKLILVGKTIIEMAEELGLSHFTISTHLKNILHKTKTNNLAKLMHWAEEQNIL